MARADFTFFCPLRVRWAEVDPVGVVFNGNYGAYIHVAFNDYLRALGLPNPMEQQQSGRVLFVRSSSIEYLASARFDDALQIGFRCTRIGRSSLTFAQEIYRDQTLLITGELVYVYADSKLGKSLALPDAWREIISQFEESKPII